MQVLALKLGKLRSEQRDTALNIPPMAQNFRGPEINHRHLVEMLPPLCRSAAETESRAPRHQAHGPGAGARPPYTTSSPIPVVGEEALP